MQLQMCMYFVVIGIRIDFKMMLRKFTFGLLQWDLWRAESFWVFLANEQAETLGKQMECKSAAQEKLRTFKGGKKELWGITAAVAENEKLSKT